MKKEGWIKLHNKFLDWEWYHDPNVLRVFLHCLLKANWKTKNWQGTTVEVGSFITSYSNLANEVGLGVQQTRTALGKLKLTNEITIKTSNKYTVIQIVNYKKYQDVTSKPTNNQQTSNKQVTTTKDYKDIKDNIPELSEFMLYAKSKLTDSDYKLKRQNLIFKYEAWKEANWIDGKGNKIKNWKSKLLHTLPHIEKTFKQQKL